jgi:hypothetical protein
MAASMTEQTAIPATPVFNISNRRFCREREHAPSPWTDGTPSAKQVLYGDHVVC